MFSTLKSSDFGSRVNDNERGGDIDLCILAQKKLTADRLKKNKLELLVAIKKSIGDQKIDLVIRCDEEKKTDHFLQEALLLWEN